MRNEHKVEYSHTVRFPVDYADTAGHIGIDLANQLSNEGLSIVLQPSPRVGAHLLTTFVLPTGQPCKLPGPGSASRHGWSPPGVSALRSASIAGACAVVGTAATLLWCVSRKRKRILVTARQSTLHRGIQRVSQQYPPAAEVMEVLYVSNFLCASDAFRHGAND